MFKEKYFFLIFFYIVFYFINSTAATTSLIDRTYKMPDGRLVTFGKARFSIPEALFNPSLIGVNRTGIHEQIHQSITETDIDFEDFYPNIVTSGGTSMFDGFTKRLKKELVNLAPVGIKVEVTTSSEPKYSAWIGGSLFASLSTFRQMCISKAEYDESGPTIVRMKCL
jgi:actin-related protein